MKTIMYIYRGKKKNYIYGSRGQLVCEAAARTHKTFSAPDTDTYAIKALQMEIHRCRAAVLAHEVETGYCFTISQCKINT